MEHELLNLQKGHFLNQEVVEATDVQHYQEKAKKIVEEAQKIRQAGNKVTYADFSKSVNDQLRVYNATMRISRLEMLKSQIGLEMVQSGIDVDKALHDKLSQDYIDEVKRQAGILGVTAKPSMWTDKNVAKIIMGQTESANFSQRLWANQAALKAQLDVVVSNGIIQGQNPREMATKLKASVAKTIANYRYVTERLARTESARVQHRAQIDSLIANDYRFCKWHAEPGRCKVCGEIASNDPDGNGRGIYEVDDVPIVPVHPNCRCSISAYWVNGQDNSHRGKHKKHVTRSSTGSSVKSKSIDEVAKVIAKSNMAKEVSPKVEKKFVEAINNAPDIVRNMYIKQGHNLHFVKSNGTPYVQGLNIRISEKDALKMKNKAPLQALVHETAHYLDAEPSSIKFTTPSDSVGLGEALRNDFYKAVYGDLPTEASLGKRPRSNSKAYPEWQKKSDELFRARRKAEEKFDNRIEELKKLDPTTTSDLSDMIEAQSSLTRIGSWNYQPLGNGHTASYWDSETTAASEFFADVTSELVTNPEALKLTKEFFPTAFEKYGEVVKLINKRTDLKYIP